MIKRHLPNVLTYFRHGSLPSVSRLWIREGPKHDMVCLLRPSRFVRSASVVFLLAVLAIVGALLEGAGARPLRGSTKWAVLLCRYTDSPPIPAGRDVAYFQQMVIDRGTGGLADYWDAISIGGLNLNGSVVRGWYQ